MANSQRLNNSSGRKAGAPGRSSRALIVAYKALKSSPATKPTMSRAACSSGSSSSSWAAISYWRSMGRKRVAGPGSETVSSKTSCLKERKRAIPSFLGTQTAAGLFSQPSRFRLGHPPMFVLTKYLN